MPSVGDAQLPLQKLGRNAALVATHQVGGQKPLRKLGAGAMEPGAGGHQFRPVAGGTFIDPRARLEPPGLATAAAGADKTARPTQRHQMLDTALLRPKPRGKFQKPRHPIPRKLRICYL